MISKVKTTSKMRTIGKMKMTTKMKKTSKLNMTYKMKTASFPKFDKPAYIILAHSLVINLLVTGKKQSY